MEIGDLGVLGAVAAKLVEPEPKLELVFAMEVHLALDRPPIRNPATSRVASRVYFSFDLC